MNNSSQPQSECGNGVCAELVGSDCCGNVKESVEAVGSGISVDAKECDFNGTVGDLDSVKVEVDLVMEDRVPPKDNSVPTGSPHQGEDFENGGAITMDVDTTMSPEKLPLKESSSVNKESSSSMRKKNPTYSSSKASVYNRVSMAAFSPARPRTLASPRKENNPTLSSTKTIKDPLDKKGHTTTSLHMSLNFTKSIAGETSAAIL